MPTNISTEMVNICKHYLQQFSHNKSDQGGHIKITMQANNQYLTTDYH